MRLHTLRLKRLLCLMLLVLLCALGTASAQPEADAPRGGNAPGGTYVFGELAGAGPFLSLNVDSDVGNDLVVRGGFGYAPTLSGVPLSVIGGVSWVPGAGTYRPEVGLSATYFTGGSDILFSAEIWPALFGGVRFHTADGSLVRLGVMVFARPDMEVVFP